MTEGTDVAALTVALEAALAERRALAYELAEAQAQAERTIDRLTAAHVDELERQAQEHDAQMAAAAAAQRRVIDALEAQLAANRTP